MFSFFGPRTPNCPVSGQPMRAVSLEVVPDSARREFARMNGYRPMAQYGWYVCDVCRIHIHQPTLQTRGERR
jgi:hypothetical protein